MARHPVARAKPTAPPVRSKPKTSPLITRPKVDRQIVFRVDAEMADFLADECRRLAPKGYNWIDISKCIRMIIGEAMARRKAGE